MPSNLDASKNADAPSTAETSLPCVHCGEPTEVHRDADPTTVFCCNGCRGAYELIHGWGLESYYGLRDQLAGGGQPIDRDGQPTSADTPSLTEPIIWVHPNPSSNPMERWYVSWPCMDCTVPPVRG